MVVLELVPCPSRCVGSQGCLKRHFYPIDEVLLCLYYIYEKPPKKCSELDDIILVLQQYIQIDDAGSRLVRASGSRWVSH